MNELDELFARHTMRPCPNCGAQKIPACLLIHCAEDEFQGVSENGFGIKCNQCGALVILYNMKGLGFFPLLAALASPLFVLANINENVALFIAAMAWFPFAWHVAEFYSKVFCPLTIGNSHYIRAFSEDFLMKQLRKDAFERHIGSLLFSICVWAGLLLFLYLK